MLITSLSLVATLAVLNLHHHSPNKPVPGILRLLLLKGLARCVCMYKQPSNAVKPIKHDQWQLHLQDVNDQKFKPENCNLPSEILQFIRKKLEDEEENDRLSNNTSDWHHAANVLDRFFLCLSFLGILLLSLSYLMVIMHGPDEKIKIERE